jgi:hypothetical protein
LNEDATMNPSKSARGDDPRSEKPVGLVNDGHAGPVVMAVLASIVLWGLAVWVAEVFIPHS